MKTAGCGFGKNGVCCSAAVDLTYVRRAAAGHAFSGATNWLFSSRHTQMLPGASFIEERDGLTRRKHLRLRHSQSSFDSHRRRPCPPFLVVYNLTLRSFQGGSVVIGKCVPLAITEPIAMRAH